METEEFFPKPNLISIADIQGITNLKSPLAVAVIFGLVGIGLIGCLSSFLIDERKRVAFLRQYHPPQPCKVGCCAGLFGSLKKEPEKDGPANKPPDQPQTKDVVIFGETDLKKDGVDVNPYLAEVVVGAPVMMPGCEEDCYTLSTGVPPTAISPMDGILAHTERPLATEQKTSSETTKKPSTRMRTIWASILAEHTFLTPFTRIVTDTYSGPQQCATHVGVLLTTLLNGAIWFGATSNPNMPMLNKIIQTVLVTIAGMILMVPARFFLTFFFAKSKSDFAPRATYPQPPIVDPLPPEVIHRIMALTGSTSPDGETGRNGVSGAPGGLLATASTQMDGVFTDGDYFQDLPQCNNPLQDTGTSISVRLLVAIADSTLQTTNPMCGVHALALVAAEEGTLASKLEDPSSAFVTKAELEGVWQQARDWLLDSAPNSVDIVKSKNRVFASRDPKSLYLLAMVALHLQLYGVATFLLKHAMIENEREYQVLSSRPSFLWATEWVCQKLFSELCELVGYSNAESESRNVALKHALQQIHLDETGRWVINERVNRCGCPDGGCFGPPELLGSPYPLATDGEEIDRFVDVSAAPPVVISRRSSFSPRSPPQNGGKTNGRSNGVRSPPAISSPQTKSKVPGLNLDDRADDDKEAVDEFYDVKGPALCPCCGAERTWTSILLTDAVIEDLDPGSMASDVAQSAVSMEDALLFIKRYDYLNALKRFSLLGDEFAACLPGPLASLLPSRPIKFADSFWLLCHIMFMQGSRVDFARFRFLKAQLQPDRSEASRKDKCLQIKGMSSPLEKFAIKRNPLQTLEALAMSRANAAQCAEWHNPVLVQLVNTQMLGWTDTLFVRPPNDDDDSLVRGNGETSGKQFGSGSILDPFHSLEAALSCVRTGQAIVLLPGVYPPFVITNLHGTSDHPISIQGLGDGLVVIQGSTHSVGSARPGKTEKFLAPLIGIKSSSFVSLSGLHVRDGGSNAIAIDRDCAYLTLSHLRMESIEQAPLILNPNRACHSIVLDSIESGEGCPTGCCVRYDQLELPHWCKYVGYGIAIFWIALCAFLCLVYSNSFVDKEDGAMMVNMWILSFFLSLLTNVLVIQPLLIGCSAFISDMSLNIAQVSVQNVL